MSRLLVDDNVVTLDGVKVGTLHPRHEPHLVPAEGWVGVTPHGLESPPYSTQRYALAWLLEPVVDGDPFDILDSEVGIQ